MLREAGDGGPVLAWLYGVEEDLAPLVAADVDVSAHSVEQHWPAGRCGRYVRATRPGAPQDRHRAFPQRGSQLRLAARVRRGSRGRARRRSRGSRHLVPPRRSRRAWPSVGSSSDSRRSSAAYEQARAAGLEPTLRHLANSAGALVVPEARLDLVRVGIAAYGIDPAPGIAALAGVALRPVMRLRSQLVNVKQIPAGASVSYGWTWTAETRHHGRPGASRLRRRDTAACQQPSLGGLVGEPGAGARQDLHGSVRCRAGCGGVAEPGEEVVVFGPGDHGEPTAADWAAWCDTIGYEIVTRIGMRVPRRYLHASPGDTSDGAERGRTGRGARTGCQRRRARGRRDRIGH